MEKYYRVQKNLQLMMFIMCIILIVVYTLMGTVGLITSSINTLACILYYMAAACWIFSSVVWFKAYRVNKKNMLEWKNG